VVQLKASGENAFRFGVLKENRTAIGLYETLGFMVFRYGTIKAFKH
jgi:ribosomal protein S18 acetylase RimI-like enzyme